MRQTTFSKAGEVNQQWHLVDADDQVLGRLASKIATILMGKHRPEYTPFVDTGDFVIVVNASKIKLTGRKAEDKYRVRFSGYPGGLKAKSLGQIRADAPDKLLLDAVRRMLPKSSLGASMLTKLKVYGGEEHPHQAQQPVALAL